MPQSKQARANGSAASATRRHRPAAPASQAQDTLVRFLAYRFAKPPESPDLPLFVVNRVPQTKTAHVLVVWDRWKDVAVTDRNRIITDAFVTANPDELGLALFPIGLTPGEALHQGFLPYQIVPVLRGKDVVGDDELKDAMQSAGGVLLQADDDLQLRFATRDQANEAFRRLLDQINKPIWTIAEEFSSGASSSIPSSAGRATRTELDLGFLREEVRRLHTQWDCFEQLYLVKGRSQLRSHASHLLAVLDVALATDIVMTISRLCDSLVMKGNAHLVFERFLSEHPSVEPEIGHKLDELRELYKKEIRPIRHGRLAHNDLLLVRGEREIKSPTIGALRRSIILCTDIVAALNAQLSKTAIGVVRSFVPGEVDWIEAALRHVEKDRRQLKAALEDVKAERGDSEGLPR